MENPNRHTYFLDISVVPDVRHSCHGMLEADLRITRLWQG